MSYHHTGLYVACEQKDCKTAATFDNPGGHSDAVLEAKAIMAGWYLPVFGGGKRLCPIHHQTLADNVGWKTLYEMPAPKGVPIKKDEASKSAKKNAKPAKEGAD